MSKLDEDLKGLAKALRPEGACRVCGEKTDRWVDAGERVRVPGLGDPITILEFDCGKHEERR